MNVRDRILLWREAAEAKLAFVKTFFTMYMDVPDKPITVSPEQYKRYKIILLVGALIGVIGIAGGIYGIVSYNAMRQQEELHEQQLELLRSKTTTLQEKMDKMDSLDQELRQMVKGAGTGESPKGEGSVAGQKKYSEDLSQAGYNELLHAASRLETKSNARIISFITLKTVLSDTAGQQVVRMQQSASKYNVSNYPSIWPVKGTITSQFGYRSSPTAGASTFHEGVDIGVDYGTPVRATASGEVTMAGWVDGYGNLVEIDHDNGIVTRYGHNSMLLVVEGQSVTTGDIIALAGSTGRSTGPHVHYEVRLNGIPNNPIMFLP